MLQRFAGTVSKHLQKPSRVIQARKTQNTQKRVVFLSNASLAPRSMVSRLRSTSMVVNSTSLYRHCSISAGEPAFELQIEDSSSTSDMELVRAYQSLNPTDRHIYDQRKVYNREISHFRQQGSYSAAIDVYKTMLNQNIPADHYTYTQLLNIYAQLKRPTSAEAVWQKMLRLVEEAAQNPDWNISHCPKTVSLPTVNAMIHVYAQSSDLDKALALFRDLKDKFGLKPDGASLQPILWLMSEKGEIAAVERMYFDYKQANPDWIPSVRLYTMLIRMYGRAGQHHMISQIFDEMREKSVKIDPVSINVVLRTLIATDEKITSDLIIKLQELGAVTKAFPVIASDLTTMSEALTLLASMKASEVAPDIHIFNALLKRVCNDYTEARNFLKMMEEEYGISPNRGTYDTLIMMAATPADRSKIPHVSEVTKEMTSRGIMPEEPTFCILLRFYSQVGEKAQAEEILSMLRAHNPILNPRTYNAIIRMHAFGGSHDRLIETLKEVQGLKIKLDTSTVDIMFKSMIRRGKFLDAANMIIFMLHNRERVQMAHLVSLYDACLYRAKMEADSDFDPSELVSGAHGKPTSSSSGMAKRTHGHIVGDLHTILQVHQVMNDTPGALSRAPVEYFAAVLTATARNGPNALCKVTGQALRSQLSPEDKTAVFVEFLKHLDKVSFTFADDIAAWKTKLDGQENRTNPLIQSQYSPFLKYVQSSSKNPSAGSRVNRPTL